ncbi:MAG: lipid II flippase MurJ, partial [Methanothrix sp.]
MPNRLALFFSRQYSVRRATVLLAVAGLLSNVLGLLRNLVFGRFNHPAVLDVYFSSFKIPDLIFNVLILGAISTAFIPVLTEVIEKRKQHPESNLISPWQVTNQVLSWITLLLVGLAIILSLFMDPVMRLVAGQLDPDRFQEAVLLSRLLLVQSVFFAWSFTLGGLLNSFNRFSSFAVAPLLYNLCLIGGGFFSARYGIRAIVASVIVGSAGHFLIQFLEARRVGFRPKLDFSRSAEFKEIMRMMLPRGLTQGVGQIVSIFYNNLGSGMAAGSIMVFNFMNDLQTTPTVIVANSMAIAFFPSLSSQLTKDDKDGANILIDKVVRATIFLLIPCVAIAYILRAQIVRLYIGIGGADWSLTQTAIITLVWFLVGIIPASLATIMGRIFYALKEVKTPLILGAISGLGGILVSLIGVK